MVQFDKNKTKITIKMGDSEIIINLNTLDWAVVIKNFDTLLQKKIKLSTGDNMLHKGRILVENFGFNIRTPFNSAYKKIPEDEKLKYNLPDINSEEYEEIFNDKTWFDFLELEHNFYMNKNVAKNKLKKVLSKNNIQLKNAKDNWKKWCKLDERLPPYPKYLWDNWKLVDYSYFEDNNTNIFS